MLPIASCQIAVRSCTCTSIPLGTTWVHTLAQTCNCKCAAAVPASTWAWLLSAGASVVNIVCTHRIKQFQEQSEGQPLALLVPALQQKQVTPLLPCRSHVSDCRFSLTVARNYCPGAADAHAHCCSTGLSTDLLLLLQTKCLELSCIVLTTLLTRLTAGCRGN